MDSVTFATETLKSQIAGLLLNSFKMNSTHIVAFLKNTGAQIIEVTNAYVNDLVIAIVRLLKIAPNAIESVVLTGNFLSGNMYDLKLANISNTAVTFQASF